METRLWVLMCLLPASASWGLRPVQGAAPAERPAQAEAAGFESGVQAQGRPAARRLRAPGGGVDLLLIPDSTADRIMAFDPANGNLLDADFVPADPTHLATPKAAIANPAGTRVLVSDQINDVIQQYDAASGAYIGIYAPAGGPNPAILDNILGIAYRPNGNLLVCVTGGTNQDTLAEFDAAGNHVGNFVSAASGGLDGPFDLLFRTTDVLVSSINSDNVLRYDRDTGAFLGVFTTVNNFPQQLALASNGNVLVANFGGTEEGVLEYTPAGGFVGRYDPPGLTGYRGVFELPNGNLLTTTGTGVHEISRAGVLVATKLGGVSAQYIEFAQGVVPVELQSFELR